MLAAFKGAGEAVAELTKKYVFDANNFHINILLLYSLLINRAMGGQVLFQDALKQRLDIIQPSQQGMQEIFKVYM